MQSVLYLYPMQPGAHIPQLSTISDFYRQLQIGEPQGDEVAVMRIEEQPDSKRMHMPLFRCNFYRVVFFTNAGVDFLLPDQQFASAKNSIYFSWPGKLESWQTSGKIHGYLLCFTEAFAHIDALHPSFDQDFPFFNFESHSLLRLSAKAATALQATMEAFINEMQSDEPDRTDMLRHLLHQYLIQLRRIYRAEIRQLSAESKNGVTIYNRFKQELDRYFTELASQEVEEQATVSLLANRLHLNASYLNTVIKKLTGKTASAYIHEKTIMEARSYLLYTDLQVSQISYRLGFTNTTYFNRFFKRLTQETPLSYRSTAR